MTTNYPTLQFWFNVLQAVLTGALFVYTRRVARQKAAEARIKNLEDRVSEAATAKAVAELRDEIDSGCRSHLERTSMMEIAAARLQVEIGNMPGRKQFDELNTSILSLNGELRNTQGRLEGINRAVDLINEFLINQGNRGQR